MIISLSGYMGAGKTAIGRELARLTGWDFVDLDDFIARAYGQTPAEIIRRHGERALRIAENQALNQLLTERDRLILALGGGTLTEPFNRHLVDNYTYRVFIDTPWEHIVRRLQAAEGPDRPLWQNDTDAQYRHYTGRLPVYREADLIFANNYDSPAGAARALYRQLSGRFFENSDQNSDR